MLKTRSQSTILLTPSSPAGESDLSFQIREYAVPRDSHRPISPENTPLLDPINTLSDIDLFLEEQWALKNSFRKNRSPARLSQDDLEAKKQNHEEKDKFKFPLRARQLRHKQIWSLHLQGESVSRICHNLKISQSQARSVLKANPETNFWLQSLYELDYSSEALQKMMVRFITEIGPFWTAKSLSVKAQKEGYRLSLLQVRRLLKSLGYRYKLNRMNFTRANVKRKLLLKNDSEKTRFKIVLTRSLEAFRSRSKILIFIDEMELRLAQTPLKCWKKPSTPMLLNRNQPHSSARAIVITACSTKELIAFQFYQEPVTGTDFSYFLVNLVRILSEKYPTIKPVLLADNAAFHNLINLDHSCIRDMLLFNVVALSLVNLVELLFSKIRTLFRNRSQQSDYAAEISQLAEIFTKANQPSDFAGYTSQWLRNLKLVVERNFKDNFSEEQGKALRP